MGRVIRYFLLVVVLLLVAAAAYVLWPRKGDLRTFDPAAVAKLETEMWRDYYNHDYKALAVALYSLYHDQYHFSPGDSVQLALYSGRAAEAFQPTASRVEAQVALPWLTKYYTLLRDRSGEVFDADAAARMELDWWQLRREHATPQQYGNVVAQVAEELFKVKNEHIEKSAQIRAEMMRYRDDRRDGKMQAEDWEHIAENLTESYQELQAGVGRTP